jgi:hypothetical protein
MNFTVYTTALFLLLTSNLFAQESRPIGKDSSAVYIEFILKDNTRIRGQLQGQTNESYIIKTTNLAIVKVYADQVIGKNIITQQAATVAYSSSVYYTNQFGFKYFLFNSAIPIEPKKWYYSNSYALFSNFNYGFNKRVSMGVTFFSFNPTALVSPKLRFTLNPDSKIKFAITAQYLYLRASISSGGDRHYQYGFVQAVMTIGSSQKNTTLGVGKFISRQGVYSGYIVMLGLVRKISPKLSFISENNLVLGSLSTSVDSFGLLSAGLRFDRRKHAFDLGLFAPTSFLQANGKLIPLPYIGYNLRLGK